MLCPFCGVEMKHGYLHTGIALWSTRKHRVSLLPKAGEEYALQLNRPQLSPHALESDFCPQCRRIILDSGPYPSSDDDIVIPEDQGPR